MNDNIVLKPSTLMKTASGAPMQFDLNLNAWFYDILSVGFSYRTGDAYVGMMELQLHKQLRLVMRMNARLPISDHILPAHMS
jgi:hypothetical protein